MSLFDTHCHLQEPDFEGDVEAVLDRARTAGLTGLALCGYDPQSNVKTLEMAAESDLLFAAVGYHPHEAKDITPAQLLELESLAALPEVVCVGEIGLDFFRGHSPQDSQRRLFDAQLEIAARLHKPVSVHTRGAEDASHDHLARYSAARGWRPGNRAVGVMHCFGGTVEQARTYIAIGFHISIACPITYPANNEARKIALELPLESLVVETDSPYLPPQPFRGKRNEPANVRFAVEAIASTRGVPAAVIAEATTSNAAQLFGVRVPSGASSW